MTERREDESLRDWLVRAEADAEDLGRSAQGEGDQTTVCIVLGRVRAYRQMAAELDRIMERDSDDRCADCMDGHHGDCTDVEDESCCCPPGADRHYFTEADEEGTQRLPIMGPTDKLDMSVPVAASLLDRWEAAIRTAVVAAVVRTTMATMGDEYDSLDREALFTRACARFGFDYDLLYQEWLRS